MIEVKHLVKKYGEHLAVDDLSFTLEKGQILGFLGPNGAGKSTTMNILTGYISATEGIVTINGHDIFDEPEEAKKCIGYLPELPPLYQDMTVREYLNFVADIKSVKKNEKRKMIDRIMRMTKITDVSERLIKQLSKGYKQRVGLAQAIIGFPEVIILDEPTVGLDPMQIIEIRDLIKELSKDHTIILSSHILSEVSAICDKVMIINKGRLIVSDTPDNLSKHIGGSQGLHLEVKGEQADIKKALESIPEITKLEFEKSSKGGIVKLSAYSAEESDIREAVFYALSDAKCPIYDMHSTKMSLEDIFLELTQEKENVHVSKNSNRLFRRSKQKNEEELAALGEEINNQESEHKEEN
ncbi:ABC transporter ATP-binding protein [Anaerocolumna xylanovorans]|uniref:ABC-2 type transport system ATP-binding protein n=1 Tax=Anaerocolumna xylanovorans DSM 12503 TaxID=1121345 RepID=A0A1M7YD48_9FIRM|nr:ABC transporter ATP-binding protein [Anaerocolumna xylanovorans]SHO50533.1 ABC-2 type transport system ATP-binding protein [Anaerocolumna xylanovorans DSM 12503]